MSMWCALKLPHQYIVWCVLVFREDHEWSRNTVCTMIVWCALVFRTDQEQSRHIKQYTYYDCVMCRGLPGRQGAEQKYKVVHRVQASNLKYCMYYDCAICSRLPGRPGAEEDIWCGIVYSQLAWHTSCTMILWGALIFQEDRGQSRNIKQYTVLWPSGKIMSREDI